MNSFFLKLARIAARVEISDVFLFGGLVMLGYGLWTHIPWVAFAVCGGILMAIGLLLGRGSGGSGGGA